MAVVSILAVHLTSVGRQQLLQGPKTVLDPVAPLPCPDEPWPADRGVEAHHGPTGGKLRYPAISSNTLPHTTLDVGVKHWEFFLLCPEPALFAFIYGCEPSKSGKKAR